MSLLLACTGAISQGGAIIVHETATAGPSTTPTLSFATTPAEDDLLVALVRALGSAVTPPAGWTEIDSFVLGTGFRLYSYYRVAGASETNSYQWIGTDSKRVVGYRISGADTASPIADFDKNSATSASSLDCATTDMDMASGALAIAVAAVAASRTASFDNSFGDAVDFGNLLHTAHRIYPSAQSAQNSTVTPSSAVDLLTRIIQVAAE